MPGSCEGVQGLTSGPDLQECASRYGGGLMNQLLY